MRRNGIRNNGHNGLKPHVTESPPSTLRSGNVTVAGRRTSIRLEPAMWQALHEIAAREGKTMHALVTEIERGRAQSSLTAATEEGHRRAGHPAPAQLPV